MVAAAARGDDAPPEGTVQLPAVEKQPIGMDTKDIDDFLRKELKTPLTRGTSFEKHWRESFLLMTPPRDVSVPEFFLGRYELSNAQWKVFLDSPRNQRRESLGGDIRTLGAFAQAAWGLAPEGPEFQAAWLHLMARNWDKLKEHLDPDGAEGWDPLARQVHEVELPAGLRLDYPRYRPPDFWRTSGRAAWWRDGTVQEVELERPAREVSWQAATGFCRWAGYHLPREVELERAARGPDGNRFAWGPAWNATACVYQGYNAALAKAREAWAEARRKDPEAAGPEPRGEPLGPSLLAVPPHPVAVHSFADFATPEGVHHLAGNVTEWTADRLWPYAGSKAEVLYRGRCLLARGANYTDHDYTLLAAGRIWDAQGPLTPGVKLEGYGVRLAAYPDSALDLTLPVALLINDPSPRNMYVETWLPTPPGLTDGERDKIGSPRKAALKGVSFERTAGVLTRAPQPADPEHHVYVTGAAQGIALLPTRGYLKTVMNNGKALAKLAKSTDGEVAFLGVLVATENATIELDESIADPDDEEAAEPRRVSVGFGEGTDEWGPMWAQDWAFRDYFYPVGAFLVLRGDRVAVYAGDPTRSRSASGDRHLRSKPLGFLPKPWKSEWVKTKDRAGSATLSGGTVAIHVLIPQLEVKGRAATTAGQGALVSIEVPVSFADD
jgi:formylglycine-generating enzyme required for sulfatase activity